MDAEQVWHKFNSLPFEAKQEVLDFIEFLQNRYPGSKARKRPHEKLKDEPFIGLWKDREDLQDSNSWLRDIRRREWKN